MSGRAAGNPHAGSVLTLARAILRTALLPALATIAAGTVVATLLVGPTGLYGALVGGGVALASSLATIGMMRFSAALPVTVVMLVALGGYGLKLIGLLLVMLVAQGVSAWHPMSLALTFLATVLVWAGAEVVAFRRTPIPTLLIDDPRLIDDPSADRPER